MKFKDTKYGDLTGQIFEGDITVSGLGLTSLEGAPHIVNGGFYCYENNLENLIGAPHKVTGTFYCSLNNMTSLKGSPKYIGGNFECNTNNLTSLEGAPLYVKGAFRCHANKLQSLKGAPLLINGEFKFDNNPKLKEEHTKWWDIYMNMSNDSINEIMLKISEEDDYIPKILRDIFIF